MSTLATRNPATGEIIKDIPLTSADQIHDFFERARAVQPLWSTLSPRKRARTLLDIRETIINHADSLIDLISKENGKPKFEALANEIIPVLEHLTYLAHQAPAILKDRGLKLRLMRHRKSYLQYYPLGVVAIISPWNYPFLLPFFQIAEALVAGNSILFKPSEHCPLLGLKIQEICDEAGLPANVLQTLIGSGELGASLIEARPDKIFFTGSSATGKKIALKAAETLTPVNLELGGKNPMIVLADANLEFATSCALWSAFSNSGQICGATSRLLVHESIADQMIVKLKEKAQTLRQGPAFNNLETDLGATTMPKQSDVYARVFEEIKAKNLRVECGGSFNEHVSGVNSFPLPTIVSGAGIEDCSFYKEECFGPILAVVPFKTINEAVTLANNTSYGLHASVITSNHALGERIARQLQAGTVVVNEATYTAGIPETPWGGIKQSGLGRTHGDIGLLEFVNIRHVHKPRSKLAVFKSWWWFPYGPYQYAAFREALNLYRRHWTDKLKSVPIFLFNLINFLKQERRL